MPPSLITLMAYLFVFIILCCKAKRDFFCGINFHSSLNELQILLSQDESNILNFAHLPMKYDSLWRLCNFSLSCSL